MSQSQNYRVMKTKLNTNWTHRIVSPSHRYTKTWAAVKKKRYPCAWNASGIFWTAAKLLRNRGMSITKINAQNQSVGPRWMSKVNPPIRSDPRSISLSKDIIDKLWQFLTLFATLVLNDSKVNFHTITMTSGWWMAQEMNWEISRWGLIARNMVPLPCVWLHPSALLSPILFPSNFGVSSITAWLLRWLLLGVVGVHHRVYKARVDVDSRLAAV